MQIIGFGRPGVLEIVDVPEPEAGRGQQRYDVSTAGIDYADTDDQETPEVVRAIVGSAPLGRSPLRRPTGAQRGSFYVDVMSR